MKIEASQPVLVTVLVAILHLTTSCSATKMSGARRASADVEQVRLTVNRAVAAFNREDLTAYMSLHADDAVVMAPHSQPTVGKPNIEKSARKLFAAAFVSEDRSIDEIRVSGEWAFVRGAFNSQVQSKSDGKLTRDSGMYVDILRRNARGNWQYARSIWNTMH